MAFCRAWVAKIEISVDDAVEGHCRRSRENHTAEDPDQILEAKQRNFAATKRDRERHGAGEHREGERENGVAKADHFQHHSSLTHDGAHRLAPHRCIKPSPNPNWSRIRATTKSIRSSRE